MTKIPTIYVFGYLLIGLGFALFIDKIPKYLWPYYLAVPFFAVPTAFVIYIYFKERRKADAETQVYDRFARQIGFNQVQEKELFAGGDRNHFSLLATRLVGVLRLTDIFRGHSGGYDSYFFNIIKSDFDIGQLVKQTAVYLRGGSLDFPHFILTPRGARGRQFGRVLHGMDKEIKVSHSDSFSKKYYVGGNDEGRIKALFQPTTMKFFESNEGLNVEAHGKELVFFKDSDIAEPSQLQEYIERAISIVKLFKHENT